MKRTIILSLFCLNACCASYGHAQVGDTDLVTSEDSEDFFAKEPITFFQGGVAHTSRGTVFPDHNQRDEKEIAYRKDFINFLLQYSDSLGKQGRFKEKKAVDGWTRDMLIFEMQFHKMRQDWYLENAKQLLSLNYLLDGTAAHLLSIAQGVVTTHAGGGRNYLIPAIAELISWGCQKGLETYNIYHEYNKNIKNATYHAELFDFHMEVLQRIYGQ